MKVGVIGSSHGIKGFIKVFTEGDTLSSAKPPLTCTVEDPRGNQSTIQIDEIRPNGNHFLLKLKGFETPETVIKYRGFSLLWKRDELPKPNSDEIYTEDLVGLLAISKETNTSLEYVITQVIDNPAHPILELNQKRRRRNCPHSFPPSVCGRLELRIQNVRNHRLGAVV